MPCYRPLYRLWRIAAAVLMLATAAYAATPEYEIEIRNHLFEPDVLEIPANTTIKLIVYHRDPTHDGSGSFELNREKDIMGNSKAIIFIGPLPPGEYPFFGEFNPTTALGKIVVKGDDHAG